MTTKTKTLPLLQRVCLLILIGGGIVQLITQYRFLSSNTIVRVVDRDGAAQAPPALRLHTTTDTVLKNHNPNNTTKDQWQTTNHNHQHPQQRPRPRPRHEQLLRDLRQRYPHIPMNQKHTREDSMNTREDESSTRSSEEEESPNPEEKEVEVEVEEQDRARAREDWFEFTPPTTTDADADGDAISSSSYERWWHGQRHYAAWYDDPDNEHGIAPFQSCHYVEDVCRIAQHSGWIYNPLLVGVHTNNTTRGTKTNTIRRRTATTATATTTLSRTNYQPHTVDYYHLFSKFHQPVVKFVNIQTDADYHDFGGDRSFYDARPKKKNRGSDWDIGYLPAIPHTHNQEQQEEQPGLPTTCSYSPIPNHFVLHGSYTHMLGEFYARIMAPLVELLHFVLELSPLAATNTTATVAPFEQQQRARLDIFRKSTKFYFSGIDDTRQKLFESHRAFLTLYSDHPVSTTNTGLSRTVLLRSAVLASVRAARNNNNNNNNMETPQHPKEETTTVDRTSHPTACSCLKRLFFCGYKYKHTYDDEDEDNEHDNNNGNDDDNNTNVTVAAAIASPSSSTATTTTTTIPILELELQGMIQGDYEENSVREKLLSVLSTTLHDSSDSNNNNSNNNEEDDSKKHQKDIQKEKGGGVRRFPKKLTTIVRTKLRRSIYDYLIRKKNGDEWHDVSNNDGDGDSDSDDNDGKSDSKEDNEQNYSNDNEGTTVSGTTTDTGNIFNDRLKQLLQTEQRKQQQTVMSLQHKPRIKINDTDTNSKIINSTNSINTTTSRSTNLDYVSEEEFMTEWKIVGLTQRSDRRGWHNHNEVMDACRDRYTNPTHKILCISIDVGSKEFRHRPELHIAAHYELSALFGVHGAQLTEAIFMHHPHSLVVEFLPFVPEKTNITGDWVRLVHRPTPLGIIFNHTNLNHIGYPLTLDSANHLSCVATYQKKIIQQQQQREQLYKKNNSSVVSIDKEELLECLEQDDHFWSDRSFTVPVEIVMYLIEHFVVKGMIKERTTRDKDYNMNSTAMIIRRSSDNTDHSDTTAPTPTTMITNVTVNTTSTAEEDMPLSSYPYYDATITPTIKFCDEFQQIAGDDYVLYNVNCIPRSGNTNTNINTHASKMAPHNYYRTEEWLEKKTHALLEW